MNDKPKIILTNERCVICDFGRAVEEGEEYPGVENVIDSIYLDGLTNGPVNDKGHRKPAEIWYHNYQDSSGRYVYIDPRDGKPICTQCAEEAKESVEEMEYEDRDYEPLSWHDEAKESWHRILRDHGPVLAEEIDYETGLPVAFDEDEYFK